jgi:outer membrane autotransporter protein
MQKKHGEVRSIHSRKNAYQFAPEDKIRYQPQFHQRGIAGAVLLLISTLAHSQAVVATDGLVHTVSGAYITTANLSPGVGLSAGQGSTINGSQVTVDTSGTQAIAVLAADGANVTLTNSLIRTKGPQASGVFASSAHASLSDTDVQTAGNWSSGVQANNNSSITVDGGTITTNGEDAHALYNIGAGANLTATGVLILTSGNGSVGGYNQAGGLMTLDNVTITTTGGDATGVLIGSKGVIGDGSTSDTTVVSNSSITTLGNNSAGLKASDNATLRATNVTVSTAGDGSFGASTLYGAQTSLRGGSITTTGNSGYGLVVVGMPASSGDPGTQAPTLDIDGVTVSTSGSSAPAAYLAGGGQLAIANSTLSATGAGSDALYATLFDTTSAATANITGSTLSSAQADGLRANGITLNATLTGSNVTAGVNAMEADNSGALNLMANATSLSGAAYVDSNATLSATLQNGSSWNVTGPSSLTSLSLDDSTVRYLSAAQINAASVALGAGGGTFDTNGFDASVVAPLSGAGALTKAGSGTLTLTGTNTYTGTTIVRDGTLQAGSSDAFSPASAFSVSSGAVLDLNDLSQTVAGVANSGTVRFGSTAGTVLTVSGDYAGNDGVLAMNTVLGDSSSATDLLRVAGSTSGNTGVQVTNRGGLGAQTTGDGIRVIEVGGASGGTFTQTAPIEAGAFQYTLYKGGVDTDATDGNWYLRSALEEPPASAAVDTGSPGAGPRVASDAPVAYRPAAVGYAMTPQLDAGYGFAMLGTLQQRVGDVPGAVQQPRNTNSNGVWGRVYADSQKVAAMNRFSADAHSAFLQFGKDWTVAAPATGGSTHAGVTATFGSASSSFSDPLRSEANLGTSTGSVQTQMQSVGGYWTRYLANGAYSDSVFQLSHYRNRYGDNQGNTPAQDGYAVTVSEEAGKPFQLANLPIAFEPQVQLAYQYMHLGAFTDNISPVSATTMNSLRGRVGFRVFQADMENSTRTSTATPYLAVNLVHDFFAAGQTNVGGTVFDANQARTRLDVAFGLTAQFGERGEFYAAVDYSHNVAGQYSRSVSGNLGYRYSW